MMLDKVDADTVDDATDNNFNGLILVVILMIYQVVIYHE